MEKLYKIGKYIVTEDEYNSASPVPNFELGIFDLSHLESRYKNESETIVSLFKNWVFIFVKNGYVLDAVKMVRLISGCGLFDAKTYVETVQERINKNA